MQPSACLVKRSKRRGFRKVKPINQALVNGATLLPKRQTLGGAVTEPLPLRGMGALVTGGAGGFGRACALALARDGATVTLMGRTEQTLNRVAADLAAAVPGADVDWVVGDATRAADVAAAVARADRTPLRICVATAEIGRAHVWTPGT